MDGIHELRSRRRVLGRQAVPEAKLDLAEEVVDEVMLVFRRPRDATKAADAVEAS